ncbi:S8 family serine peptidase [Flavobacterium sp. CS20]|uniref:S8 family peptidase n=1 Tax=Flavobacterium sp. CS20 TaxID=2775246 RepID=UPI001B3A16EE|nr:S8 family serine peptidase [Flavobacterium sp. CS20]QTY26336.1 S8 family serine peptidase [Flavobacterium sp. CS20]
MSADTNNFDDQGNPIGIASIGYNTSLITSNRFNGPTPTFPHPFDNASTLTQRMLFLVQQHPEIRVLTHSIKESCSYIDANALVYEEIWVNYDVTVITVAGNGNWKNSCPDGDGGDQGYVYPASYDHVISVGAVGHHYKCRPINANGNGVGWKDSHQFISGNTYYTFTHNDRVDIVAPGYGIPTTDEDDKYSTGFGTSFSGPFVCGIVALMYAVHPNITPDEVRQILRDTADDIYHIPENQQYIGELGTGRVNAYAAVRTAECMANPVSGVDLITLNSDDDFGDEPDNNTNIIWESDDIWVRNTQDPDRLYADCHEDLYYIDENTPVYVYVRVTNDGRTTSSGNDVLKLYWAKGGLNQTWSTVWEGDNNPQPAPNGTPGLYDVGNQVGGITGGKIIPALKTK